jgi:3-oxoacyl-[acyl-carrier-protein] synthase-3
MSIEAIGVATPSWAQSAQDVAAQTGADADFIANKVGMAHRHILSPQETGVSLATAACEDLFKRNADLRNKIRLLVCITQNPDQRLPHNSPKIAYALGLDSSVATFDISLGCSGFIYGIEIVEAFLARCGWEHGVLVTCDPYSRIIAPEDRDTNCVFGDAATATWVNARGTRSRTLATDFGTDGSASSAICIPAGGAARPLVSLLPDSPNPLPSRDDLRLHMNGRAVFNFVLDRIPASIQTCLHRANCQLTDIDYFVLHQGSTFMLEALAKKCQLDRSRLVINMKNYGNVVSSSIPLILSELDSAGSLAGSRVLMSGFGVGLSWASAVVQFE